VGSGLRLNVPGQCLARCLLRQAPEAPIRFNTFSEKEMSMKVSAIITAGLLCFTPAVISAQTVSDAQIASIVVTANQVDTDAGKLAASKATNPEVKKFGQQMVTDHTSVNKQATALVKKLKVTPEDNPTSQSLKSDGDKNLAHLKTLEGAAFDKAYIDNEVTYHQAVIDAIDKTLIPSAQNAELKALLVKSRPAFVAHLEHAKTIQSSLVK
jgi:putative membrane protein